MSSVCVLTPIVVGSWPMIASAIAGAAASLGFAVSAESLGGLSVEGKERVTVETEVPNSEVLAETMARGEKVRLERQGVTVEFGIDERGRCSACVSGESVSKAELKRIGDEVVGRVVQQFAYHKLMTELKHRKFRIVDEMVQKDSSIQVRVRLDR